MTERRLAGWAVALLLGAAATPALAAPAATDAPWGAVEAWVGKYPTDGEGKAARRLLDLPRLRTTLAALLPAADVALVRGFEVEKVVEARDGYYLIGMCRAHDCGNRNATVVLSRTDAGAWADVFAAQNGKVTNHVAGTASWSTLPPDIKAKLLHE